MNTFSRFARDGATEKRKTVIESWILNIIARDGEVEERTIYDAFPGWETKDVRSCLQGLERQSAVFREERGENSAAFYTLALRVNVPYAALDSGAVEA